MEYKDYYQVLGVSPQASTEDIRKVYKKLAVQYHPDRNPGNKAAENRFKEISEAKEILLDPANRQRYDALRQQYLYRQQAAQQRYRPTPGAPPPEPEGEANFASFFEEIFGARRRGPRPGKNYEANVKISLEEAYKGMTDVLSFEGRRLRIRIRPGIADGQILRIKGQGGSGKQGGPNGDLYLTIKIRPHEHFTRDGNDLSMTLPIDVYDVMLGKKVKVPSLKGVKSIAIPPGTQPAGERLKLRGLGMPHYDQPDRFGDLYLKLEMRLPERLSPEERRLIEQLSAMRKKS